MIISENIYFIIVFSIPAAIYLLFNRYIKFVPKTQADKSIELAECFFFSVIVFLFNSIVCGILETDLFNSLIHIDESLNYKFVVSYIVLTLISSVFILVIYYKKLRKVILEVINFFNKKNKRPIEDIRESIWEMLFEDNKKVDIFNVCVVVKKDGNIVSAGIVESFSPPQSDHRELLLMETDYIMDILKEDTYKCCEDRTFSQHLYDYVDVNLGVVYSFYSLDKYKR